MDRKDQGEDMSLFVKNVENVQGDERDFIIFSTTFGRNDSGQFRRNFGALGHAGGERRLNVAVTRARRKVIVIGSMPIQEISDMLSTRRQPQVPRDYLQAYLHYAKLMSDGQLDEAKRLADRLVLVDNPPITSGHRMMRSSNQYRISCANWDMSRSPPRTILSWESTSRFETQIREGSVWASSAIRRITA